MRHEGRSRQHIQKWDRFVDLENYALLAEDFREDEPARRSGDFREGE
jgi:RimJ/RimL family protein N-acetyltransferase